jgi:hypothetical protein
VVDDKSAERIPLGRHVQFQAPAVAARLDVERPVADLDANARDLAHHLGAVFVRQSDSHVGYAG